MSTGRKLLFVLFCFSFAAMSAPAGDVAKVRERLKNDPYMIPFYTGRILPTPRKVEYGGDFLDLSNCGIVIGKGLTKNDARLKLFLDRVGRYGGACEFVGGKDAKHSVVFAFGATEIGKGVSPPAKQQGYVVKCLKRGGKPVVIVKGSDYLGLTWAVNSLVQMITLRGDETVMRSFDAEDYPYVIGRGCVGPNTHDFVSTSKIYPLMTKFDWIVYTKSVLVPRRSAPLKWIDWRYPRPPKLTAKVAEIGRNLKGLGISWEMGIMPYAIGTGIEKQKQIDSKGDEDFKIIWKMCEVILKAGGGIHYTPDDYRYPLSPADKKNFGSAREADIYFMNRLYRKIKSEYPNATVSMVQPFYHGPTGINSWSDESPIEYLKGLGKGLPKDIKLAWTGPSVKSRGFTKKDVAKFVALIKREPYFFQNSTDFYHIFRYVYPGDKIKWWLGEGRSKEIYKEFSVSIMNSLSLYSDMMWSAMLWNPEGFDVDASARDAACKLVGPENYGKLRKVVSALAWFDQFERLKPSPYAARKFKEIETRLVELKKLNDEFEKESSHPSAIKKWASLAWPIRGVDVVLYQGLKKNKDLRQFVSQGAATVDTAKKEVASFNPKNDRIFTSYEFKGAFTPRKIYGRYATWAYGAKSKHSEMTLSFGIEPYPPTSPYVLLLCGRDGGGASNCAIEITLNGKSLFKGPNPFKRKEWSLQKFNIPLPMLNRGNKLTIKNIEDTAKAGVPFFSLNYAVVRKLGEKVK